MSIFTQSQPATPRFHLLPIFALGIALLLAAAVLLWGPLALGGLAAIAAFALFLRYPAVGLYVTTVLLLLSGTSGVIGPLRVAIPLTGAKICGGVALAAWVVNLLVRRQRIVFSREMFILLGFLVWAGIGVFASTSFTQQWPEWFRIGTFVAFYALAVNLLERPKDLHRFLIILCLCGLGMSLYAIAQYLLPSMHLETQTAISEIGAGAEGAYVDPDSLSGGAAVRVSGRAGHSNWLAMTLLVLLPLNLYWFRAVNRKSAKVLVIATVLAELAALVLTFTRTGFLVGSVVALLIIAGRHIRLTPARVVAFLMAILVAFFLLPGPYKERVLHFSQYSRSDSVSYRIELQQAAFDIATESPLWGVGLGGYGLRIIEKTSQVAQTMRWLVEDQNWNPVFLGPHNFYLQLLCDTGIIGLGIMLLFFGVLLLRLRHARNVYERMGAPRLALMVSVVTLALIAFLLSAIFLHALQQKIWWMIAAFATVLVIAPERMSHLETQASQPPAQPEAR